MDHAEARELLEEAAVEPGGFERLIAGDTSDASALAGHLAGCSACAAEMESVGRASAIVRDAVRSLPPPDLRERTLAFVAAVGRPRVDGPPRVPRPAATEIPSRLAQRRARRLTGSVGWAASIAAAVAIAIVGTALVVGQVGRPADTAPDEVAALSRVATWSLRIDGQADARRVDLAATDRATGSPSGTLLFSPGSRELVVLVEGLERPPAGQEYRCWMAHETERTRVGRMFFSGDVAFWVGEVPALGGVVEGTTFGVTLVPATGDTVEGPPVLVGEL